MSSEMHPFIARLSQSLALDAAQSKSMFDIIMSGGATDAQIGGVLMALRVKGETVDEITGAAQAMRERSRKVTVDAPYLVDTCGTGGSGSAKLFNISTAAAFVAAAAGAHVAKHGNRAASSKSGSADVLEAAGVNLKLDPSQIARCIKDVGVGFLFAPAHHSAMKHAIGPRRELGVRTLFNLLGPLTNPAGAKRQLIGVFDPQWLAPVASVLQRLGAEHAMIVHSGGLDEIALDAPTEVAELNQGRIERYQMAPEQFGIERGAHGALVADDPRSSLELVKQALTDADSAAAHIVALNAGAAIYVAGVATSLAHGVSMAQDAISAGLANERLAELVRISSLMGEP